MIINSLAAKPRGTTGYADHAADLIARYEALAPAYKHAEVLHLIPSAPSRVLDVGAGSGADAGWLASMGHEVLAVEPTDAFRRFAEQHHASPRITWLDDCLPELGRVVARRETYALIMLTAVWMHLDESERRTAIGILAGLLTPGGALVMAVRQGPVPEGRLMYEVPSMETIALAGACGLDCVLSVETESRQAANREAGVTWSRLAFRWTDVSTRTRY